MIYIIINIYIYIYYLIKCKIEKMVDKLNLFENLDIVWCIYKLNGENFEVWDLMRVIKLKNFIWFTKVDNLRVIKVFLWLFLQFKPLFGKAKIIWLQFWFSIHILIKLFLKFKTLNTFDFYL
jgi:hypothetical protein